MPSRSSHPIATLFGIPMHVHWSALLTGVLIAFSASSIVGVGDAGALAQVLVGALAAVLFGVSLLAHEYAHALMARRHGIGVRRVNLWALGGLAELQQEPRRWAQEFSVSVVGPLMSLAIGAVGAGAAVGLDALGWRVPATLLAWVAVVNVVLAVFNLLPGFPLDGGRVLHSLLWWRSGDRNRATVVTGTTGRFIGVALVGLGVWSFLSGGNGLITALVGWFVLSSAANAREAGRRAGRLTGIRCGDVARPVPTAVDGRLSVGEFVRSWTPHLDPRDDAVLLIDETRTTTGLVPMDAVWHVPPPHRDLLPMSALSIDVSALTVVSPNTDLAEAVGTSASGAILVSEPERLVGVILPSDLGSIERSHRTPAGTAP